MPAAKSKWPKKTWRKWMLKRNRSTNTWPSQWSSWDKLSRPATQPWSRPSKTRSTCRMKSGIRFRRRSRWWSNSSNSYRISTSLLSKRKMKFHRQPRLAPPARAISVWSPRLSNCRARICKLMIQQLCRFQHHSLHLSHRKSSIELLILLHLPSLLRLRHHLLMLKVKKKIKVKRAKIKCLLIPWIKQILHQKLLRKMWRMKPSKQRPFQSPNY